jgi:biotin operon repressor
VLFNDREKSIKKLEILDGKLKKSFNAVKEEMEEHLQAINENTDEISAVYEHISELDCKMDKLSARMEQMQLMIKQIIQSQAQMGFKINLDFEEQKIFLALYAFGDNLTMQDIARRTNLNEIDVEKKIEIMKSKGINVLEKAIGIKKFYSLEKEFKNLQAKTHVVEIDRVVANQIFNKQIVV